MTRLWVMGVAVTLLSSCKGGGTAMGDGVAMGGVDADASGAAAVDGAGASDGIQAKPDFGAVQALLVQRAAAAGVTSLGLTIWDSQDHKVYEHMLGAFTPDTRVAIASASKLVSGLVVFDVIRRGQLSLEATTGQVLSWTGPNAAITLRHLLSFTSGLPPEAACTLRPLTTLADCAQTLEATAAVASPGARFDYGSTHLHVAAAMAEKASGQLWADLFAQVLRTPLGLPGDVTYYTFPKQTIGTINPLVAGGLRASVNDYQPFLAIAFHKGSYRSVTVGTPALFDEQAREPFPDAVIGKSPLPAFRYGLASWLECGTPATGCERLASPGAFGFTPWFDRRAGYYAILGMELASTGSDEGVVAFAVSLQAELQPLVAAEIAKQ